MKEAATAGDGRPPQDGPEARALRRAAGMILLFNGLLVAWVLLKPGSDRTLALVVNTAQFVGPLLVLPLCFGGLMRWKWRRKGSGQDVVPGGGGAPRFAPCPVGRGVPLW